jgi:hypothetical protein
MTVTIPLGLRERLTIGRVPGCGGGWWTMRWQKRQLPDWHGEEPPPAGDREPLVPRLPTLDGAIALPPDADAEFR